MIPSLKNQIIILSILNENFKYTFFGTNNEIVNFPSI